MKRTKIRTLFVLLFAALMMSLLFITVFPGCSGGGGSGDGSGGDPVPTVPPTSSPTSSPTPSPEPSPTTSWLSPNTTYNWQVEAWNNQGNGTDGPKWTFTTSGKSSSEFSGGVTPHIARKVALSFVNKQRRRVESGEKFSDVMSQMPGDPIGELTELKHIETGDTTGYVFNLSPKGYVVVSGDSSITPIIAYSYTSNFSWSEAEENILLHMLKNDLQNRFKAKGMRVLSDEKVSLHRRMWSYYLNTDENVTNRGTIIGPLFTFATWHQYSPYNQDCPVDPQTSLRSKVGCVAISMAQIMNYWKSPRFVTFTSSDDYVTGTRKIPVEAETANFSGINYNNGNPSDDVKAAICFAAGVLVKMDYTSSASGAYTASTAEAFNNRLGYEGARYDDYMSKPFDPSNLISNMNKEQPAIISIGGQSGVGHALNVDGYDSGADTFHLNYGWDGNTDGWYSLPDGLPTELNVIRGSVLDIHIAGVIPSPSPSPTATVSPSPSVGPDVPDSPNPSNYQENVSTDSTLVWEPCSGADYYNLYIWPANEPKPSTPTVRNLKTSFYKP